MKTRCPILALCALAAAASAAPNPNPIDTGTAHVIAVNDNLACSSGACNDTAVRNTTAAESSANSTSMSSYEGSYSNDASAVFRDAWSPWTFSAAGLLAFSTGML